MATRRVMPRGDVYGIIERGASTTIPVSLKTPYDNPIDLTGMRVSFTVKKVREDFDRDDSFAYIKKDFAPQEPLDGRFLILLTSSDTDFEPGEYYFDIQLSDAEGAVHRLVTLKFDLRGGPSNRNVNEGAGQLSVHNEISVMSLTEQPPIIIIGPLMAWAPSTYAQIDKLKEELDAHAVQIQDLLERIEVLEGV